MQKGVNACIPEGCCHFHHFAMIIIVTSDTNITVLYCVNFGSYCVVAYKRMSKKVIKR